MANEKTKGYFTVYCVLNVHDTLTAKNVDTCMA